MTHKLLISSKSIARMAEKSQGDEGNTQLCLLKEDLAVPRVFPQKNMPLRVLVARTRKLYAAFDLNKALGRVEWKTEALELIHFDCQVDSWTEDIQTQSLMDKRLLRARAYHSPSSTFKIFTVTAIHLNLLRGQFESSEQVQLPRLYMCFDFENPEKYAKRVLRAQNFRAKVIDECKYNFYIDNMDLEGAQDMPGTLRRGIALRGANVDEEVNDLFKRCMNEILLTHSLKHNTYPGEHLIPPRPSKYRPRHALTHQKTFTLTKQNKLYKLTLKSFSTKKRDFESNTLYFKDQITLLMVTVAKKLELLKEMNIFDLGKRECMLQRFVADQYLSTDYFVLALSEDIFPQISKLIRDQLQKSTDSWFKLYELDRLTYLGSKLRRLFVLIEQIVRDRIKDKILAEISKLDSLFKSHIEQLRRPDQISHIMGSILTIQVGFVHGKLKLGLTETQICNTLLKMIWEVLNKIDSLPSPQSKALPQIYAMYKEQGDLSLNLGASLDSLSWVSNAVPKASSLSVFQAEWLSASGTALRDHIIATAQTLTSITTSLLQASEQLQLETIFAKMDSSKKVPEIVEELHFYHQAKCKLETLLPQEKRQYGIFCVNHSQAKKHLFELLNQKKMLLQETLIKEFELASLTAELTLNKLKESLSSKPANVYELVQQRRQLQNLESTFQELSLSKIIALFDLCQKQGCRVPLTLAQRRWENSHKIKKLFELRERKGEEFQEMRKVVVNQVNIQICDFQEQMADFRRKTEELKAFVAREKHIECNDRANSILIHLRHLKAVVADISFKQAKMNLPRTDFGSFMEFEQSFQLLFVCWRKVGQWEELSKRWMNSSFKDFELENPEFVLNAIISSLTSVEAGIRQLQLPELFEIITNVKWEIDQFMGEKLKLLKILKKKGFTRKHLHKIGIELTEDLHCLSLRQAIEMNFLQKMVQIESVSTEAWNEFFLEQILEKVYRQLLTFRFSVFSSFDGKGSETPLIRNYEQLTEAVQDVILNLQSMEYNPMKVLYEPRIRDLYLKSLYISKCLESCSRLQTNLVQIYPIFDSADIVKQLPAETKKFLRVVRSWTETVRYMEKIQSVYDACNSQNISEKMTQLNSHLEKIKSSLGEYLRQKRKGFNRFYLLSDHELFAFFSSTNDIQALVKMVSKLFNSITSLTTATSKDSTTHFTHAIAGPSSLELIRAVQFHRVNLEEWLSQLERVLLLTVRTEVNRVVCMPNKKWQKLISEECSQAVLLCYEIEKSNQLRDVGELKKWLSCTKKTIGKLVDSKRNKELSALEKINVSSLLVLAIYFWDKMSSLVQNAVSDSFEFKRLLRVTYEDGEVTISSFQNVLHYGFEYLGAIKRLVITNLTEKMQLIYMSAINCSLGGAAIGPAGTGKSQTTKDIARMCGKVCLIYNCSDQMPLSSIVQILKGMAATGLWVCFDQFNRLNYRVLSVMGQQLGTLFKYRAMGLSIQISFHQDMVQLCPDFHFCVTYNPQYTGRQSMPKSLLDYFRTVAMVNVDKRAISQMILYSHGFKQAEEIARKLTLLFETSEYYFAALQNYDFGLRTLLSVIELASKMRTNQDNGAENIFRSIQVLVLPRLMTPHKHIFLRFYDRAFLGEKLTKQPIDEKAIILDEALQVREGVILAGSFLSGKTSLVMEYEYKMRQWRFEHIYVSILTVKQIYGYLDLTTNLWHDGYLTKKIRDHLKFTKHQRLLLILNGAIEPGWVENLNSVLDNNRLLSLSSGEVIMIPPSIKVIISTPHLQFATPATITRSCVINCQQKPISSILRGGPPQTHLIILNFSITLRRKLFSHFRIQLDQRLVMYWANTFLNKVGFSMEYFISFLSILYEHSLTSEGKRIFQAYVAEQLHQEAIFNFYWNGKSWTDLTTANFLPQSLSSSEANVCLEQLYIPNVRDGKLMQIMKSFYSTPTFSNFFLIIGPANAGKSTSFMRATKKLVSTSLSIKSIYLCKRSLSEDFSEKTREFLVKRMSKKIGAAPGSKVVVWLESLDMPKSNEFQVSSLQEVVRLVLEKKGWYDQSTLEFQTVEDVLLAGDYRLRKDRVNISNELLKSAVPYIIDELNLNECLNIFRKLIAHCQIVNAKLEVFGVLESVLKFLSSLQITSLVGKWSFMDLKRVFEGSCEWILRCQDKDISLSIIQSIFVSQLQRVVQSQILEKEKSIQFTAELQKWFLEKQMPQYVYHALSLTAEKTTIWDDSNCILLEDHDTFLREIECVADEYRASQPNNKSDYIIYPKFVEVLCKITKCLATQEGNLVLIGLPKSGKKMLLELSTYLLRGSIFTFMGRYEQKAWLDFLKSASKHCYSSKTTSIMVIEHAQLKTEPQKEQIDLFLKSYYLPVLYSEADFEQIVYLFQSALLRRGMQASKENAIQMLTSLQKDKLHAVIMMNPSERDFHRIIEDIPGIAKQCCFCELTQWPKEALLSVAMHKITPIELALKVDFLPQIHQICKGVAAGAVNSYMWEGKYFDFLQNVDFLYKSNAKILQLAKDRLDKSISIIAQTEEKLEKTKEDIKRLQPAILMLEKEAIRTIKSLNLERANAEVMKETLRSKEVECSDIIKQATVLKEGLQRRNQRVEEELSKAWENVHLVKQNHIAEIKSLTNPSEMIRMVIGAMVIIFHEGPMVKEKNESGFGFDDNYFETGKKYILSKDSKQITRMLTDYKKESITREIVSKLQEKCLTQPKWNLQEAKNANKAIYYFFIWVEAVVQYFRLFEETIPLRKELEQTGRLLLQKQRQISQVSKDLLLYEKKIEDLASNHSIKTTKLQEYGSQIKYFEVVLNRGYEVIKQIINEKAKWFAYRTAILNRIFCNYGDSLVSALMTVYYTQHPRETRKALLQLLHSLLQLNQVPYSPVSWLHGVEDERKLKELGVSEDNFLVDNLKVIDFSKRLVLLIDPEEEGINLLQRRNKREERLPYARVDEHSPLLSKKLQQTVSNGHLLFVEVEGVDIPDTIRFIMEPKWVTDDKSGVNELVCGQKTIVVHAMHKVYLFTTDTGSYSLDLVSKVSVVDFTITQVQLQQKLLTTLVSAEHPELQQQLEECSKIQMRDEHQLKMIEKNVLDIFAGLESCETILENEDTLHTLATSNRIYRQIQLKISASIENRAKITQQKKMLADRATRASQLYFQIRNLSAISRFYSYDFEWFIRLFERHSHDFAQTLCHQVSNGLPPSLKVLVPLLIAQQQHPEIPFRTLFSTPGESPPGLLKGFGSSLSAERRNRIVGKISQIGRFIPNLSELVQRRGDAFLQLMSWEGDVMEGIPDECSDLDFFNKIQIVSIFRPDCVIGLLEKWFELNIGFTFNSSPFRLLDSVPNDVPILILRDEQDTTSPKQRIFQLHDRLYGSEKSVTHVTVASSGVPTTLLMIQSSILSNQWVILSGVGQDHEELFGSILDTFEGSVRHAAHFRLWIVVEKQQMELIRLKYIKWCYKVVFSMQSELLQQIKQSFLKEQADMRKQNLTEKHQRRYLASQICIFHHLLNQKAKYSLKSWNKPLTFNEEDLRSTLRFLRVASSEHIKTILPDIVKSITYGGKIMDCGDIDTLSLCITETLKNTILEKNQFWQSIWADDSFPRSAEEYQQYIKNLLSKQTAPPLKNLFKQFGISRKLLNYFLVRQYRQITAFYALSQQATYLPEILTAMLSQVSTALSAPFTGINTHLNVFTDLFNEHRNSLLQIMGDILEDIRRAKNGDISLRLTLSGNRLPSKWVSFTVYSATTWLKERLFALKQLSNVIEQCRQKTESQIAAQVTLSMRSLQNFAAVEECLHTLACTNRETHYLSWGPKEGEEKQKNEGVAVCDWFIWNAQISNHLLSPSVQEAPQMYSYTQMPFGCFSVRPKEEVQKSGYLRIPIYLTSFEYENSPCKLGTVWMPSAKIPDTNWVIFDRVHLTLRI